MKKEILETQLKLRHICSSYRENRTEYLSRVLAKLKIDFVDISKEEHEEIKALEITYKRDIDSPIFFQVEALPENSEHIFAIEMCEKYMELLVEYKERIDERLEAITPKASEQDKNQFEKAELEKKRFETDCHIQSLSKVIVNRKDYYYNKFKPRYDIELKEAKENVLLLIERAKKAAEKSGDAYIGLILKGYFEGKAKKDDDLWLFYTTLKQRLQNLDKHNRQNKKHGVVKKVDFSKKNYV